ncbi:MAG: efflux RND transporter periplasmic adaptor subunit [Gammaproteobacteria bacterium]
MRGIAGFVFLLGTLLAGCGAPPEPNDQGGSKASRGDGEHAEEAEGPHGGKLLHEGPLELEVTVYEQGVPPEFRVYAHRNGQPVPLKQVNLTMEITRLGGETDRFSFSPQGNYLVGEGEVREPHSFDVRVQAAHEGREYSWNYASYEGRTTIAPKAAEAADIEVNQAGPAIIHETLALTGSIHMIPERLAHVRARYAGVIRSVNARLNDTVKAGDELASVQSNESLQTYAVTAPVDGVVLELDATAGEATGGEEMFVIADLSKLWAELDLFARDMTRIQVGQRVRIKSLDGVRSAQGRIEMLSPTASTLSQSVRARAVLDNRDGQWRPGQFVRGVITVAETLVPLAVRRAAIQQFRDFQVVFARVGDTYEVRMLELGRRGAAHVEVKGGLAPGETYVVRNSYLIKADIEKSGASHDH